MVKYKLIKEYPGSPTLGTIAWDTGFRWNFLKNGVCIDYKPYRDFNPKDYSEFWMKAKPLFYTEDFKDGSFPEKACRNCIYAFKELNSPTCRKCMNIEKHPNWRGQLTGEPIYEGDWCWKVNKSTIEYNTWTGGKLWDETKYFSDAENARNYYISVKEPKFKVGDYIVANYRIGVPGYRGQIAKIESPTLYSYLDGTVELNTDNFEGCRKATKKEIEEATYIFTTEDGIRKYIGDEIGYLVDDLLGISYSKTELYKGIKIFSSYKHFDNKENAENYIARQIAAKRGIKVGDIVFHHLSKIAIRVDSINSSYPDTSGVILEETKGIRPKKHHSKHVKTLNELVEEEDLKIGMKLDPELLYAWNDECERASLFDTISGVIEDFTTYATCLNIKPSFEVDGYSFPLVGFKKFRQEWNKNKGSDFDIDNLKANTGKFKRGDKVVITRKAKNKEGNWNNNWVSDMDKNIGKVLKVGLAFKDGKGYHMEDGWNYPEFVMMDALEYAKLKYPIGTKFRRIDMPHVIFTVNNNPVFDSSENIRVGTSKCEWHMYMKGGQSNPSIYEDGKWAEIVEEDTPTLIVIDHLHLIKPLTKQRSEELKKFMRELRNIMKPWKK